jgi:hypothetical protein
LIKAIRTSGHGAEVLRFACCFAMSFLSFFRGVVLVSSNAEIESAAGTLIIGNKTGIENAVCIGPLTVGTIKPLLKSV